MEQRVNARRLERLRGKAHTREVNLMLRGTLVLVILTTACSSEPVPDKQRIPPKGPSADKDAAAEQDAAPEQDAATPQEPAFDVRECEGMPTVDYFSMLPSTPMPPIFSYADTSCKRKSPSVLLVNATKHAVRVTGVGVTHPILDSDSAADDSAEFLAFARGLPRELGSQEVIVTEVEFRTRVPHVTAVGDIVVATPEGCQRVGQLRGISYRVGEGAGFAPLVVDFGVLRPGQAGPVVDVEFLFGRAKSSSGGSFSIAGAMPRDVFRTLELISEDISDTCERKVVPMQMTAPDAAGPVDGLLFVEVQTSTTAGVAQISLRGLVRE